MTKSQILCNYLRFMDYVIAWELIPIGERPQYNVIRDSVDSE